MKSFTTNSVIITAAFSTVAVMGALTQVGIRPAQAQQPGQSAVQSVAEDNSIRPFRVNISQEAIIELRRRIAATRWPDRETVDDQSQGIQLAKIKPLVEYWGTRYDWRKAGGHQG